MAGNVDKRVEYLIQRLEALRLAAGLSQEELKRFNSVIKSVGLGQGFAPDLYKTVTTINELAAALSRAGMTEPTINRLRQTMLRLAETYDNYGSASRRLQITRGLPPAERMGTMMEARRRQREQARYFREASEGFAPSELAGKTSEQIRDEIGARAASLQMIDQIQNKLVETAINQRQITLEVNAQKEAYREVVGAVREQVDAEKQRQQAYERAYTYSGRLRAGVQERDDRERRQAQIDQLNREAQEQPVPIREALQPYEAFIPGGATGIKNLQQRLEALGVTQVNSINATRELSNGITTMSVSMTESSGAVVRGSVHMDRFGNVLQDTSRRFRSFADAVGTNIIKVTQWALATGVVYGVVRQLSQVFREIIEIQSQLAEVQIALGQGQGDLNEVFEAALDIANLTSLSVGGVVEAYALAYRATGGYADEAERLVVTNNLLQESMILAKLAGTDQATSLDTLVGALRQTGMELDQGRDLLDKWVFVSRQANVSLDTLAQTYAIVGSTAQGVGIEMEELNALAATLAEATGLSATETGNAIRGIISGFQSATAEQTLARFGIATRDATGQIRDFMDLYLELAQLTQSGVLSDRDITEISQAVGGGYRRAAQVETLFKNHQEVQRLITDQAEAGGASADALQIRMDTVESAITRLGNAFTKFAETLGMDGGLLSTVTGIVEGMTGLLNILTELTAGLGKATPALVAFGAAWAVLSSSRGQDIFKSILGAPLPGMLANLGPIGDQQLISSRLASYTGGAGLTGAATLGGGFQTMRQSIAGKMGGLDPLGLIAPLLIAGSAVRAGVEEDDPLEFGRAGTSVVGAIIGGLVTAGNPLGIAAGSAMASSFFQGLVQYDADLTTWWGEIIRKAEEGEEVGEETAQAIEDSFGFGARAFAGVMSALGTAGQWFAPTGGGGLLGTGIGSREGLDELDPRAFLTGMAMQQGGVGVGSLGPLLPSSLVSALVPGDVAQQVLDAIDAQFVEAKLEGVGLEEELSDVIENLRGTIGPVFEGFMEEMQNELVLGEIGLQEFIQIPQTTNVGQLASQMAKITTAADFAGMGVDVQEFTRFMLELDDATRTYVVTLASDVVNNMRAYNEEVKLNGENTQEATELQNNYNDAVARFSTMVPAIQQQQRLAEIPRLQTFDVGRATPQQSAMAVALAKQFQRAYFLALADGNEELADLMEEQVEPVLLRYGEGLGQRFGESVAVGSQYLTEAFSSLGFDDLLGDVAFQFQDLRDSLSLEDIPELMQRYSKVVGTFQTFFPDYDVEEQDVGLITKTGLSTVHADLTLLNLAMQDLIDVNEQQLEGVWNIPQGMTAFVAWSSLFSRSATGDDQFSAFDELFSEDRKDQLDADEQQLSVLQDLETRLAELDAAIASTESLLSEEGRAGLGGMYDIVAENLAELQLEREDIAAQLAAAQLGGAFGLPAGEVSVVDQLREALTIQNRIELNANIRLVVDGRTLANIVKQYLFEDLASAADKTIGTGSGDYVITK